MAGYNPYLSGAPYGTQENTYGGAATNGYTGSRTNSSMANAAAQSKPVGGPEAFGRAAMLWAQPLGRKKVKAPGASDATAPPALSGPPYASAPPAFSGPSAPPSFSGPFVPPHLGGSPYDPSTPPQIGGGGVPPSFAPPPAYGGGSPVPPFMSYDPLTGLSSASQNYGFTSMPDAFTPDQPGSGPPLDPSGGNGGGQNPSDPANPDNPTTPDKPADPTIPTTPGNPNPLGRGRPSNPTAGVVDVSKSGLDPQYQAVLQGWLQGHPEYSWLADPKYSWLVPQYFEDASKGPNTDVVDWLHSRMQSIVGLDQSKIDTMDPAYKRSGNDTYLGNYGSSSDPNAPTLQPWQQWEGSGGTGGGRVTTTPVYDQMAAAAAQQPSAATPAPPAAPAPPTSPSDGTNGVASSQAYLRNLMQGLFSQEQEDYLRGLSAHGATTGAINSGAFQESQSRGLSDLINNQNAQLATNTFTADQNNQQRALQKAIADLESQTQIKSSQIGAGATLGAAQAGAGASRYKSNLDYQQFLQQLPYQDKWQGYNFQLGEDQVNNSGLQYLLSLIYGSSSPNIQLPFQFQPGYLR